MIKLCWQKKLGNHIDYGWDDGFKTGVGINSCSIYISVKGYFIGFCKKVYLPLAK